MYSLELEEDVNLTLAASGWTYRNLFVLADHRTESLWYHLDGTSALTCISGEYADRTLPELFSAKTPWRSWVSEHPTSRFWDR